MTAFEQDAELRAAVADQLTSLDGRLAAGAHLVGWKLGLGAPTTMRQVGIDAPLVGYLTSTTVLASGAEVSLAGWARPVLEPEVAVTLAADLPAGAGPEAARAAIGGLAPAIELADVDVPLSELAAVLRGDIFHRHVILGRPRPAASVDVADVRVRVRNHGREVAATDDAEAATGRLVDLLAHVADWLAGTGRRLEAGQVVIAGSTVPLVAVAPGDAITYRCEPLGELAVSFTA